MHKHILYLASGSSRRFGGNKLLHMLEGKPMFLHGLQTLAAAAAAVPGCSLTVVSRYGQIRETAAQMGIRAVDSPDSDRGIAHTVRAAIESLENVAPGDFLLFAVADQPWLKADSICRLLEAAEGDTECACLCWEDRPGNPTLFSARLIPELLALEGDTGGRAVLRKHTPLLVQAGSARELEDVDTR